MEDIPPAEEEMNPSKGDVTHALSQDPSQETTTKAKLPTRKSSRIWKAQARSTKSREQESINWNTAFATVQGQE